MRCMTDGTAPIREISTLSSLPPTPHTFITAWIMICKRKLAVVGDTGTRKLLTRTFELYTRGNFYWQSVLRQKPVIGAQ
jgi:hypothetical protein